MIEETPTGPRGRPSRTALAFTGEHRMSLKEIRPAVFFDRDGTLIKDVGYIHDPAEVELVPHAANAVRRVNYALWPVIVVTNQSGIARSLVTEEEYERVRERVDDLLAERGAYVTEHYHCPHHPDFTGPCHCRKPGVGMFEQAMHDHAINLASSVFVGDRWRDVEPALEFGGRGILVPTPFTPQAEVDRARREMEVASTLTQAIHIILHV